VQARQAVAHKVQAPADKDLQLQLWLCSSCLLQPAKGISHTAQHSCIAGGQVLSADACTAAYHDSCSGHNKRTHSSMWQLPPCTCSVQFVSVPSS